MSEKVSNFAPDFRIRMVGVAQLVRVPDCGSEGRGFEPHLPPQERDRIGLSLFLSPTFHTLSEKVPKSGKVTSYTASFDSHKAMFP